MASTVSSLVDRINRFQFNKTAVLVTQPFHTIFMMRENMYICAIVII